MGWPAYRTCAQVAALAAEDTPAGAPVKLKKGQVLDVAGRPTVAQAHGLYASKPLSRELQQAAAEHNRKIRKAAI